MADNAPEVIVIDLAMPDGEGIETIQVLRRDGYTGVVIAMSGAFAAPIRRTAELLGADACLAKPFQRGELACIAARLLVGRWAGPATA